MKKYFILAAAAAMFAACSNTDDIAQTPDVQGERIPLAIGATTGSNAVMRGNLTALQGDTLSQHVSVGLYIYKETNKNKTSGEDYEKENEEMGGTTTTTGKLDISPKTSGVSLVYPDKKDQGIDLYAYAPYTSSTVSDIGNNKLSIETKLDQTKHTDYLASDFLWGSVGNGIENTNTVLSTQPTHNTISAEKYQDRNNSPGGYDGITGKVLLPLYHVGSKITINLIPEGMALSKLVGATVKFYVAKDKGVLDITTGKISNLGASATAPIAITLTDANLGKDDSGTEITSYSAGKGGYSDDNSTLKGFSCAAVILPQDVNETPDSDYRLIEIVLDTNTTYVYTISAKQTFSPLKEYVYNINVKASGLEVTTQVTDWVAGFSGTEGDGDAVLE